MTDLTTEDLGTAVRCSHQFNAATLECCYGLVSNVLIVLLISEATHLAFRKLLPYIWKLFCTFSTLLILLIVGLKIMHL
jgi:tryptophan-rich sensory protein